MKKSIVFLDPLPHSCRYTSQMSFTGYNQLIPQVQSLNQFKLKIYEWCRANCYLPTKDKTRTRLYSIIPRGIRHITPNSYICPSAEFYAWTQRADIIHHINADDSFLYQGILKRFSGGQLVGTVHLPIPTFQQWMPKYWIKLYNAFDTLITLSSREFRFFQKNLRHVNVVQIPHGNDNNKFFPSKLETNIGICIGGMLRDFQTLVKSMNAISKSHPNFKLYMISRRKPASFQFPVEKNIVVKFNIPDKDLLQLYRTASMLILPLKDCTANNSILEGLASGLPIITNKVGGIPDYTNEKCASYFESGDVNTLTDNINYLLDNPVEIKRMSREALGKSKEFDWSEVAKKIIKDVYLKG